MKLKIDVEMQILNVSTPNIETFLNIYGRKTKKKIERKKMIISEKMVIVFLK